MSETNQSQEAATGAAPVNGEPGSEPSREELKAEVARLRAQLAATEAKLSQALADRKEYLKAFFSLIPAEEIDFDEEEFFRTRGTRQPIDEVIAELERETEPR
jgi:hypothetical protein